MTARDDELDKEYQNRFDDRRVKKLHHFALPKQFYFDSLIDSRNTEIYQCIYAKNDETKIFSFLISILSLIQLRNFGTGPVELVKPAFLIFHETTVNAYLFPEWRLLALRSEDKRTV